MVCRRVVLFRLVMGLSLSKISFCCGFYARVSCCNSVDLSYSVRSRIVICFSAFI